MSPLWRDKLCVALRPDRFEAVRRSAGWRPKISDSVTPCEALDGQSHWTAPFAAFKQHLQAIDTKCDVTIVLSNHFLRYVCVPWSDALVNDGERLAFARIRFEQIYGDISRRWAIRVSKAGYGQSCIASAMDQDLIDSLQSACAGKNIRLSSIQPWLMMAINRYCQQLKERDFRLLIAEPGQLCVLHSHQGGAIEVKSQLIRLSLEAELNLLLDREAAVAPSGARPRPYLIATGFPTSEFTPAISRKFQLLEPPKRESTQADPAGAYGMAMCGSFP